MAFGASDSFSPAQYIALLQDMYQQQCPSNTRAETVNAVDAAALEKAQQEGTVVGAPLEAIHLQQAITVVQVCLLTFAWAGEFSPISHLVAHLWCVWGVCCHPMT